MLRDRMLRRRGLVAIIVAWAVVVSALPRLADAEPSRDEALGAPPAGSVGPWDSEPRPEVLAGPEARVIRARLAALGVSPAEIERVLARLDPAERAEMAARVDELDAGGNGVAALAVAIIVGLLVILVLELMGRRVISRP